MGTRKHVYQSPPSTTTYLQRVLQELVHPGNLARNTEVDGAVADLDDQAAVDIRVDL